MSIKGTLGEPNSERASRNIPRKGQARSTWDVDLKSGFQHGLFSLPLITITITNNQSRRPVMLGHSHLLIFLAGLSAIKTALAYCSPVKYYYLSADGSSLVPLTAGGYLPSTVRLYGESDPDDPRCREVTFVVRRSGWYEWKTVTFGVAPGSASQFSVELTDLIDESYTMTSYVSGPGMGGYATPGEFKVASAPCIASVGSESVGRTFGARPFPLSGTTRSGCRDVTLFIKSVSDSSKDYETKGISNGDTWWRIDWPPADLPEGEYTIQAQSKAVDGSPRADSAVSDPISVYIDKSPCSGIDLVSPAIGSVVTQRQPVLSGTVKDPKFNCGGLELYMDGGTSPVAYGSADNSGFFIYFQAPLQDGLHNFRAVRKDYQNERDQSLTEFSFTVNGGTCATPIITSPATTPFTTSGSKFTVGGTVGEAYCKFLTVSIPSLSREVLVQASWDKRFSAILSNLPVGTHDVEIRAAGNSIGLYRSAPATFPITVTAGCSAPIITSPTPDANGIVSIPWILTGRITDPACNIVYTYINGARYGPETIGSDLTFSRPGYDQAYYTTVYATAESATSAAVESVPIRFLATSGPVCGMPRLVSPAPGGVVNGRSVTFSGTLDNNPACGILVARSDDRSVYATMTIDASGTSFTGTYNFQTDGKYTLYLLRAGSLTPNTYTTVETERFDISVFEAPCTAPVLTSPQAGDRIFNEIIFSGTVDDRPECGRIDVYLDGAVIYSTAPTTSTGSGGSRRRAITRTFTFPLSTSEIANGEHQLYVVNTGQNNGVASEPITVTITNGVAPSVSSLQVGPATDNR